MDMELTAADKERIEQEWHKILFADNNDDVDQCAAKLAEYATIYEREQQVEKQKVTVERLCKVNERIQRLEAERADLLAKVSEQEKEIAALKSNVGAQVDIEIQLREENERLKEDVKKWQNDFERVRKERFEQSEQIKKLEELLNDVLNDVQYADHKIDKDLRNEIKAAIGI